MNSLAKVDRVLSKDKIVLIEQRHKDNFLYIEDLFEGFNDMHVP